MEIAWWYIVASIIWRSDVLIGDVADQVSATVFQFDSADCRRIPSAADLFRNA